MLTGTMIFLVLGLIAAIMGYGTIAVLAVQLAWAVLAVGMLLTVVLTLKNR